ncbi:MAG: hypothetical protein Alpg2KO_18360 [Alphaproteobacteria bacterium]
MAASVRVMSFVHKSPIAWSPRGAVEVLGDRAAYVLLLSVATKAVLKLRLDRTGHITVQYSDTGAYLPPDMKLDLRDEHDQVMVEADVAALGWGVGWSPGDIRRYLEPPLNPSYIDMDLDRLTAWMAVMVDYFERRPAVAVSTSWHSAVDRLVPNQTTPFVESMLPENMAAEPLVIITASETKAASGHDAAAELGVMGAGQSILLNFLSQLELEEPRPLDEIASLFLDFDGLRQCAELATPFADPAFTADMMGARAHAQHRRACFCDTLAALLAARRRDDAALPRIIGEARSAITSTTGRSLARKIREESRGQYFGAINWTSRCLSAASRELERMGRHEIAAFGYVKAVRMAAELTEKHALAPQEFADLQILLGEETRFLDVLDKEREIDTFSANRYEFAIETLDDLRSAQVMLRVEEKAIA